MSGEGSYKKRINVKGGASTSDLAHSLLAAFDALAAERDAALKRCDKLEAFITYIESPALKAWRALDAEERASAIEDLKTWADLVERGLGDGGTGTHRGFFVAAAALEALGEPRP